MFITSSDGLRAVLCAAVIFVFCAAAAGQNAPEHRFTANFGGGFTMTTGKVSQRLDNGWNISGGAGVNLLAPLSLTLQATYNGLGATTALLNAANAPDASARVWSITVDPRLQLSTFHSISPYLVGGVGYYRRTVDFTQPGLVPITVFDPFFGFLSGAIPADIVINSVSKGGIGGSLGAGFAFGLGERTGPARFFAEARYHYADTGVVPTRMIPVTFGVRF